MNVVSLFISLKNFSIRIPFRLKYKDCHAVDCKRLLRKVIDYSVSQTNMTQSQNN